MNIANLKVTCGLRSHLLFLAPDCWCLFTGIICVQPQTWCESAGCGRGRGNGASRLYFLIFSVFLSNWDGAPPGLGALRKQHSLHISTVHIAQTGPQASNLNGAGARIIYLLFIYLLPALQQINKRFLDFPLTSNECLLALIIVIINIIIIIKRAIAYNDTFKVVLTIWIREICFTRIVTQTNKPSLDFPFL